MADVILPRRAFLAGLAAAIAAPAIVRVASIMPIKQMNWQELRYARDGEFRYYSGYDVLNVSPEMVEILNQRIEKAESVFVSSVRQRIDAIIYREGTGASGGLNKLFA